MIITLDTNVLISGTYWQGEAFQILKLIEEKKVKCVLSRAILAEYDKVMHSGEIIEKVEQKRLVVKSAVVKV